MNILHISRTMNQGGAEKIVYQLCENNTCTIASTGGVYVKKLEEKNVSHYIIPDIDNKNPVKMIQTFSILSKIIKENKIDIIHSHHRMAAFYAQLLSKKYKHIKLVYTAHNVFYNKKKLLNYALKNTKIVAVGNGVKRNLTDYYHIPESRIDVIYNAIQVKMENKEDSELNQLKEQNRILIGNIGRLSEQKGMDIFIKAIKQCTQTNKSIVGVIVGDGEDRQKLEDLVQELKISENIVFLGFREDVFDIIKQLDFVVLSSRWEGFPLTPIEVFSMQKTIIASNISGNNEIVKDEENGLLFEKGNVEELCDKINTLISDTKKKNELEENAKKTFNEKFSYETFINSYRNIYNTEE